MKHLILAVALLAATCTSALAADHPFAAFAGVNGVWFDGPGTQFPRDFEAGGNARVSASPHLSAVGAAYYGFDQSYFRWSVGGRVTVTDVDNPNFSIGLGMQYHGASEAAVRPSEWIPDASFGFKPFPLAANLKNWIVVGQGGYGLTSQKARAILGLRYQLPL